MDADNEAKITNPVEGADKSAQVAVEETAEAKITRLEGEKSETTQQLEQWKKEAKAHQATALKQGLELKRFREQAPRSDTTSKAVLDILKEQYGDDPRVLNLQATIAKEEERGRLVQQVALMQDAKSKLEQRIKDAGLDPEDEQFYTVWDAVEIRYMNDGEFDKAEKRLDRILSKVTPKKEEKKENEEEIARRVMEQKGLLKTDTGLPSGDNLTFEKARDAYIQNPRDLEVRDAYMRARRKRK